MTARKPPQTQAILHILPAGAAFVLPPDPAVMLVTAGSSAAGAGFVSVDVVPDLMPPYTTPLRQLPDCVPPSWDGMAVPVPNAAVDGATAEPGIGLGYRLLDGSYTDQCGLINLLSQMQGDCAASLLPDEECAELSLASFNAYIPSAAPRETNFEPFFSDFAGPSVAPTGNVVVPPLTIFAEPYPSDWVPYATTEARSIQSTFWSGTLTTVDNPGNGIVGGWRIRVLLLNYNSYGVTAPIFGMDACVHETFDNIYGVAAQSQEAGLRSVLAAFLTASEAPHHEWVSRSSLPREEDGVEREEDIYEGRISKFVLVSLWFLCLYTFGYLALTAVQGVLMGRERWWAGPYLTGQMIGGSMGDHSITATWWDRFCTAVGIWTEDDSLFFGPQHAVPVAMPSRLLLCGFRSRIEDPWDRPPHAQHFYQDKAKVSGLGRTDRAHRWGAGRVVDANLDSRSARSSVEDKHLEIERSVTAEEEQVSSRFETL